MKKIKVCQSIFLADAVPHTPGISGRWTLIALFILISAAMYLRPKSNAVEKSAMSDVTTQVVMKGWGR